MGVLFIKLRDFFVEPEKQVNLASMPPSEVARLIKESFAFLADDVEVSIEGDEAVIAFAEPDASKLVQAQENYDRGIAEARRGEYTKAIKYMKRTLAIIPNHPDARRNLAMAHLENGNVPKAKEHLLECIKLNPEDGWSYVLLANIAAKHDRDAETAEFYYEKGLSISPRDHFLLNNYAALLVKGGKLQRARELFNEALSIDPSYPNTYLGLAMVDRQESHLEEGIARLKELFSMPLSEDIRSGEVYAGARKLYLELCQDMCEKNHDEMMSVVLAGKAKLEKDLGIPIRLTQDDTLQGAKASTRMAWRHGLKEHVIRYKGENKVFLPHILAHEMEHILLESEARQANKNRTFTLTKESSERAIRSLGDHVKFLEKLGYPEQEIGTIIQQMVYGAGYQVFNNPLDMVVESRLHKRYPTLEPCQFASVSHMCQEPLRLLTDKELRNLSPALVYDATLSLNCATALFAEHLFPKRTQYAEAYRSTSAFAMGQRLYEIWKSQAETLTPGDEYLLVDEFAEVLKLKDWIDWSPDSEGDPEPSSEPMTNFSDRESEAMMFCLDALKRYEKLSPGATYEVGKEIALLGVSGIDFRTPGKTYELESLPGETFTGLHLLCLMQVGLKLATPSLETGLDLDNAYHLALEAFKGHIQ